MIKPGDGEQLNATMQEKILSCISDVIVIIDKNGTVTYKSPNVEKIFGWKPHELVGGLVWDNLHPEDLDSAQKFFATLLKEYNSSGSIECRYKSKDGAYKWIQFNGTNLLNDKEINGILGKYHNITERKEVELALEKSGNLFRTLFNNLASAASLYEVITDKDGNPFDYRFVSVNTTYEQYTGRKERQLIGKTLLKTYPDTEKIWLDALEQVYLTGTPLKLENYAGEIDMYVSLVVYRPQKNMVALIGTDITEQRRAEKSLKENEEKFRSIVERLNEAIYKMNLPEGTYEYFSPAVIKVFGYRVEDFASNPLLIKAIIHPDFNEYFNNEFAKLLNGDVSPTFEYKIIDPDGNERWIYQSNTGIFDDDGKIIAIEGLCRNITQQKNAEEELVRSESILKSTLESMNEGVLIVNSEGTITHSNTRFKEIFSFTEDLLHSRDDNELIEFAKNQLKEPDNFTKSIDKIYQSNEPSDDLLYFKDYRIVERLSYPLQKDSPVKGRVWLFRDITEKKQNEEKLKKFKSATDNSMDGVYWINKEGGFDYINNGACKMLGYTYEELIRLKLPDIDSSAQLEDYKATWDRLNNSRKLEWHSFESRHRRKNGTDVHVEISSVFMWMDNKGLIISYVKDISERKEYEETLLKNQKMLSDSQRIALLGCWELNLADEKLYWNKETLQILGFQNEVITPSLETFFDITHPDDKEIPGNHFKTTLETKIFEDFECRIVRPDGKIISVIIAGEVVLDEKGEPARFFGILQDITERKRTLEEITKSAREKEMLMKSMANAFVMWEPLYNENNKIIDLRFSYINEAYERIAGVKYEEVKGRRILDVWPTTELDWFDIFGEIVETGNLKTFDKYFAPTGGYYSCNAYLPWNTPDRLCVVFEDITERKKHEEAIMKSQKLLKESQRIARIGSFDLDLKTSDIIWSEETYNIFSYKTYDNAISLDTFYSFVHPEDLESMKSLFEKAIEKKRLNDFECRIITKDNMIKILSAAGEVLFDEFNNPVRILGIVQDITERKQSEEAIIKNQKLLNESQRIARIGSWDMDLSNFEVIWSKHTYSIFGYKTTVDPISLDVFFSFIHPDDVQFVKEVLDRALATNAIDDFECRIIRKDNVTRTVLIVGEFLFDDSGHPLRMLGAVQDITERKKIEDEFQRMNAELESRVEERTAQLQRANNELESFAYSVSHDLRAPLRHISGFLRLLKDTAEPSDSKAQGYFEKIEMSSNGMSVMIDELLKFSRLGRTELNYHNIRLSGVIDDILERFKPDYEERNILWKIKELPIVKGDPVLLRIALENLISNAIKYTSTKEIAEIEVGEFNVGENMYGFYVKDNGVGFDTKYSDKLFGVFQRLHNQKEFEGVGIGLANVKQIISKHKGSISAVSKLNEGATFLVKLPK